VRDEAGADHLPDQSAEVRSDEAHLLPEVDVELLSVLGESDDLAGEGANVQQVDGADVLA
jgi:hypothetical protein